VTHAEYLSHRIDIRPGEKLLDALLRNGVPVPFSCRGGICHSCMLRCAEGVVPPAAQRGLSAHLRDRGYLLPCLCIPESDLVLEPRRGIDMLTHCVLLDVQGLGTPFVRLRFDTATMFDYRPGQRLQLVIPNGPEPMLVLTSDPAEGPTITAALHCPAGAPELPWLRDAQFSTEFEVRGPLDDDRSVPAGEGAEQEVPHPDPALWHELGDGATVRAVLEDFYALVYEDPLLSPYFTRVTKARAIDKQYAFMRQMLTGERGDFVERPRNAHHWMVIPPAVFDHRQSLMVHTLQAHGIDASRIARWTRIEEHYRRDIVKTEPWPKRVGDQLVDLESFAWETLAVASLCDYCGAEVVAGTRVRYHRRLGHISCPACTSSRPEER
jgi:ferredoxin/truncated hemoglobin YjbI